MSELLIWEGRTPKGNPITLSYRENTVDLMTIQQTVLRDEYELGKLDLTGWAIDAGGYLGSVTVMLALDNPELKIVVLEPIQENRELISANLVANGVHERVTIDPRALTDDSVRSMTINYNPNSTSGFVGTNVDGKPIFDAATKQAKVKTVTLSTLLKKRELPALLKIDIEGGEYTALRDVAVRQLPLIIGEWHPVEGGGTAALEILLAGSHDLTLSGQDEWYGIFRAARSARADGMRDVPKCVAEFRPPHLAKAWERCQIDSLEVAARWLEMGDKARNGDRPISREEALQCVRMVQQEIIEKERAG